MTTTPKFSILHTSARPAKWREIYETWLRAADHPEDVQYILVVDERWGFPVATDRSYGNMRAQDRMTFNNARRCYVEGVNLAAELATGEVLIVNADDQYPCLHWDTLLTKAMEVSRPVESGPAGMDPLHDEFVLAANTGTPTERERGIVVMPIMSRARYERLGYVFYPQYESTYADNDLCSHAVEDKCLFGLNREWLFPHRHPFYSGTAMDAAYEAQNRQEAYALGAEIFKRRQAARFADIEPVTMNAAEPRKHLCVLMPGRYWPLEFMSNWSDLLLRLIAVVNVTPIFGSSSSVAGVRHILAQQALQHVEPKPDFVLWMDDDNVLPFPQLMAMFETLHNNPEISAVAAWCWLLYPAGATSCGLLDVKGKVQPFSESHMAAAPSDLIDVDYTGFPSILMRREVLELAGPHPFAPFLSDDFEFGFSGEDYAFCVRARAAGARIVVDRRLRIEHLKLGMIGGPANAPAAPAKDIPDPVLETTLKGE